MKANVLRGEIVAHGMTVSSLAEAIKMRPKTLYNKLNGNSQFTIDEAVEICRVLEITDANRKAFIFLD